MVKNVIPFRTPYDGKHKRVQFETSGPSLTQQDFADECDIHNIIKAYAKNGTIDHLNTGEALYSDFSSVTDLKDMMLKVKDANDAFMQVPSHIRKNFQNDPTVFYDFVNNPDNLNELKELGLIKTVEQNQDTDSISPQDMETPLENSKDSPKDKSTEPT
jgi:phage internal scaffolding protein